MIGKKKKKKKRKGKRSYNLQEPVNQAPFCGSVSNAETVFSNLIRCRGAPLCLIAQAVFSPRGQRAFSMENT